ncbi:MAG: hypothetical protein AAF514_04830 [Verrucomicrobiota bacterium]
MSEGNQNTLVATSICSVVILLLLLVVVGYQQSMQSDHLREIRRDLNELHAQVYARNSIVIPGSALPTGSSALLAGRAQPAPAAPTEEPAASMTAEPIETEAEVNARLAALEATMRAENAALPVTAPESSLNDLPPALEERTDAAAALEADLERIRRERLASGGSASGGAQPPAMLAALQKPEVLKAPAIAYIKEYNKDFGFCVLQPGTEMWVELGDRLAIRQGEELIGMLVITASEADHSIGEIRALSEGKEPLNGDHLIGIPDPE